MFDGAFWYHYYYYIGWASFNIGNEQEHSTTNNHMFNGFIFAANGYNQIESFFSANFKKFIFRFLINCSPSKL